MPLAYLLKSHLQDSLPSTSTMPLSIRRRNSPVPTRVDPDRKVRTYFPTLHPLILLMDYRTAGEYVPSLIADGYQAQPLPRSPSLIDAMISITGYESSSLPVLFQTQARDQGHVIETDAARYVYNTSPTGEICSLRVMSKEDDDDGPYALFLQKEDQVTVMEICDPTKEKQFVEYRRPDGSIRSTLYVVGQYKDLSVEFTGGTYYLAAPSRTPAVEDPQGWQEEHAIEDDLSQWHYEDEGPKPHS